MAYTYTQLPMQLTLQDYKDAIVAILYRLEDDQIVSVYTTGEIGAPGISDIDIVIITKDILPDADVLAEKVMNYMHQQNIFIQHQPIIIPRKYAELLPKIYPLFDFKLVCGENLKLRSNIDKESAMIYLLNEIAISGYSPMLEYLKPCEIPIRHCLSRLSSMKYLVRLYEIATGSHLPGFIAYKKEVDELRHNWDNSKQKCYTIMHRLIRTNLKLQKKLYISLDRHLQNITSVNADKVKLYIYPRVRTYSLTPNASQGEIPISFLAPILDNPPIKHFVSELPAYSFVYSKRNKEIIADCAKIYKFKSENSLPAKSFNKFIIRGRLDALKREVVKYL